jgi:hypothetical protein
MEKYEGGLFSNAGNVIVCNVAGGESSVDIVIQHAT